MSFISLKELNTIELDIFNNITFEDFNLFIHNIGNGVNNLLNIMKKNLKYNQVALKIMTINNTSKIINYNKLYFNLQLENSHSYQIEDYFFLDFSKKIINNSSSSNLYFGCKLEFIQKLEKINIKTDNFIFKNEEYIDDYFKIALNYYSSLYKINYIDNNVFKSIIKYDNIFLRINDFNSIYALPVFMQLKFPNFLYTLINTFLNLKKGGNFFYIIPLLHINSAYKKLLELLVNSFEKINIFKNNNEINYYVMIYGLNFKDNISDKLIKKLIKIFKQIKNKNYIISEFINYYYNISTINKNNKFMYKLNLEKEKKEEKYKNIKIVDDIDIDIDIKNLSIDTLLLINNLENIYKSFFINANLLIIKYNINNDSNLFLKYIYQTIQDYILICKENKIPFNKSYLVYIDKYNKNLVNQLHSLENTIKSLLVKPKTFNQEQQWKKLKLFNKSLEQSKLSLKSLILKKKTQKKPITKLSQKEHLEPYYFEELNKFQEMYKLGIQVNNSVLESLFENNDKIQSRKVPLVIKFITDNYSRGVAKYINENSKFKLSFNITNGFTKMWEILETIPSLLPNSQKQDRQQLKVFFIAEAPGQWIYAINYYTQKKLSNVKKVDWRATSLNPKHPLNLERYGKGILDDAYGFIKHYPKNWLWGVDETGDITKAENIRWYHQYVKEWDKPDLVTGDAGLQSDNPLIYQKLELAQVVMVAGVSQKGGNCIIKHFLPYIPDIPETEHSNGFFINYLYLYYLMFEDVYLLKPLSSNPVSGEFYLIGKKFIGLNEEIFEKLLNLIENFEVNMCFFDKKDIPENFKKQVFVFIEKLTRLNVDFIDIQNNLLTCLKTKDEVIEKATECRKYLNPKYMEEIQESKFKKWCELYNFH